MKNITVQLETLACPSCVLKIESAIKSLKGINEDSIKVMFNASRVRFDFDSNIVSSNEIENAITNVGYEVKRVRIKDL